MWGVGPCAFGAGWQLPNDKDIVRRAGDLLRIPGMLSEVFNQLLSTTISKSTDASRAYTRITLSSDRPAASDQLCQGSNWSCNAHRNRVCLLHCCRVGRWNMSWAILQQQMLLLPLWKNLCWILDRLTDSCTYREVPGRDSLHICLHRQALDPVWLWSN